MRVCVGFRFWFYEVQASGTYRRLCDLWKTHYGVVGVVADCRNNSLPLPLLF